METMGFGGEMFGGDKEGKVMMLMPSIMELGQEAMSDEKVLGQLQELLRLVSPRITEDDLMEQTMFAVFAIKKHNVTIKEAHQLILDVKALDYCFEKFMKGGGMEAFFGADQPVH